MSENADDDIENKSPADTIHVRHDVVDNDNDGVDDNAKDNVDDNNDKGKTTTSNDQSSDNSLSLNGSTIFKPNNDASSTNTSPNHEDINNKTTHLTNVTNTVSPSSSDTVTQTDCHHSQCKDTEQKSQQTTTNSENNRNLTTDHEGGIRCQTTSRSTDIHHVPIDVTTTVLTNSDNTTKTLNPIDTTPQEAITNGEIFTTTTSKYDASNNGTLSGDATLDSSVIRDDICDNGKITKNDTKHPKSILKNAKSFPVLAVSDRIGGSHPKFFKHALSAGLIETRGSKPLLFQKRNFASITNSASSPEIESGYFRSSQEFVNPAFELDEAVPSDSRLADIVEQVLKSQPGQDRYVHPFGKSNMYATVLLGERSKYQSMGRFIFWIMFALGLAGVAGAIIMMSEMYRIERENTGKYSNVSNGV